MIFKEHLEDLKKADWPKCVQLADELARIPGSADTLEAATKARAHHVRSAALKALFRVDRPRGLKCAERLIEDSSYEVRMDAAEMLGRKPPDKAATPQSVAWARGRRRKTTRPGTGGP